MEMPKYKEYGTGEYVPFFAFKDGEFRKVVTEQVKNAYPNMEDKIVDLEENWRDEEVYYDLSVMPTKGNETFLIAIVSLGLIIGFCKKRKMK